MNNLHCPPGRRQERRGQEQNRQRGVYGDHLKQKQGGMVRIFFQNPQGIGPISNDRARQSSKITKLKDFILNHKVDIVGLSETNKDWRAIPQKETFWQCTDGWFELRRLITSINKKVPVRNQLQYGGTLLMAINRIAHSVTKLDKDPRRLGRWSSILIRGKNNRLCRIICAYCPCSSTGPMSTYACQIIGLAKANITECPRSQFWIDLKTYISECKENSEQVIVMGDWNSNYIEVVQWMNTLGLKDIIQDRHKIPPPPTCLWSSKAPLDAIFTPESFQCWRGGFLSFDFLEGDHRGLWVDIPVEFLLGYNMQHPAHPKARRLKTTDPRVKKRYTKFLHQYLQQQGVYDRMSQLYESMQKNIVPTDLLHFEELDETITEAMERAERKCRKLKTGTIQWSPLYQQACDKITYWTLILKEAQGLRVNNRKILSLRKKLKLTEEPNLSLDKIQKKLALATRSCKQCKKYAPELQMEYRYQLAKAKEAEDNIPAATHIQNLTHQENTRALFCRIRYLERKVSNLSTSRLTISDSTGNTREIFHRSQVERQIMQANEKKYHQAEGISQLTKGQLFKDIGPLGIGPQVTNILRGTYVPPSGTSSATKAFLKEMKTSATYSVCPPITFQTFKEGWRKTKEKTSSSGPHFGHYRAAISHPYLAKLFFQRAMIPMTTGYSPSRHRKGIDVMLLKKENNYHVDHLRTIVLFDSEANMNYKHLGRRAMKYALAQKGIATEQYSRPQRKAIDHALNRKLVMDHQLYRRQPYAITCCDLKSCYDRILHGPASLALQHVGMPQTEVASMFDSIQRMTHTVRTSFGDSTSSYGNHNTKKWSLPPQGVLQGNGSGPAIWSILSSVIFRMLQNQGHQNQFESSIRLILLSLSGFAYVDDSDLLQVGESIRQVVKKMQDKLKAWVAGVGVTGGILAPMKCWWYLVTFKYKLGQWRADTPSGEASLWIKNHGQAPITIQRLDTSTGMNMLGVHLAPDGNVKDHVQYLRHKAESWASNMKHSHGNKIETWMALHRTIPFAMCYSLQATTLSQEDCRYVMAPIYKTGLPLAGIAATTPTVIRSSPITTGGFGMIDPYLHMGISQIETLITHLWKGTPTGKLLAISMDDIALEIGLSTLWTQEAIRKGLLYANTHSWIRHVLQFTLNLDISLHIDGVLFPRQRVQDRTIMQSALQYTSKVPHLRSINSVRMALNVVWLSEISNATGTCIDRKWFKMPDHIPLRNHFRWPSTHHVTTTDWCRWRRFLGALCQNDTTTLIHPLGYWQRSYPEWIDTWQSFTTNNGEELYIQHQPTARWRRHIRRPERRGRHHHRYFKEYLVFAVLPSHLGPLNRTSYTEHATYFEVTATDTFGPRNPSPARSLLCPWDNVQPTSTSITTAIRNTLQPAYIETTERLDILLDEFSHGQIVAVSDGSFLSSTRSAAAAWILESQCKSQWIMGSIYTPGSEQDFSAYRSELTGLAAISVTIKILSTCCPSPPQVIIACDGLSALNVLTTPKETITANSPHADLQSIIVDLWAESATKPLPVHVKGHQDTTGRSLNRLEELNVMMDRLAKLTA
jgi:Reverse transcriptase (RNA-dependent DNA polymerase).